MARAAHKRLAVNRNAKKLRTAYADHLAAATFDDYGNEIFNEDSFDEDENTGANVPIFGTEEEIGSMPADYYENMLYGIIDGLTADFDMNCSSSMYGVVNGGFRAVEYKNVANPTNTIKFQMSINTFTESINSVYAFCDFTHLYAQVGMLLDTEDWE